MRCLAIFVVLFASAVLARAEKLTFSGLKADESIVIGYRSRGCWNFLERKYVVHGGDRLRFDIYERASYRRDETAHQGPERLIGGSRLTDREALGLDSYLYYLRCSHDMWSTIQDDVSLGYYRNEVKIGEDHYVDSSGGLAQFHRKNGKLIVPDEIPALFPSSVFRAIVPPWLIEERIAEPKTGLDGMFK